MKTNTTRLAALLSAAALALPMLAEPAAKKKAPMDEKAMMELWQQMATPGEAHKALEKAVGSWTATTKTWMAAGAPPAESAGTTEMKMVLGGRWLQQSFEGTFMGQPFSGIGYTGYDNYKKKYISTWMDTLSTMAMVMEGTRDPKDGSITSTGKIDDFMQKKVVTVKTKISFPDADSMTYEMWNPGPDGKAFKSLEVSYKRKK